MACEITAVNDDLDDETSAFIEKHASILDEDDPFLCFIDVLDDHRAIFLTKLLQRIISHQGRYCIASIDGDPRSRPTCCFGEPVHCFAAIRPVSKVTEHCQTASRKSDRTLHRPLSCAASAWRWYESATPAIP
ncbi:hypothetical protein PAPYR_6653 [Paratrimastix pyriformis]|uniref:Uncharacterized protein n=1 Tax=Paratrimastix pyriformis TaxID=342808 RepID=A0ABQ8UH63_9EUKA|nr:hypothetical protein PAPYR_6653 [Paratrimastix pyriformis]